MNHQNSQLGHLYTSLCVVGGMLLLSGCRPDRPRVAAYYGPTEPIHSVVAGVNHNADRIPTLRGGGAFEAWIKDEAGKTSFINGSVTLLFARPGSIRLIGKKDIAGQVFELGANDDRYWVIVRGDVDTMWTGTFANIQTLDPKQIPIRPDLLLEVLGVQPIPSDLLAQPVPVMRFNNDADAYMLVWSVRLNDRWAAQKEVWYDRTTKLPKLVNLFDDNGRIVLRAYLSEHKPLEAERPGAPDGSAGAQPMVASKYDLFFPDSGSRMTIALDDVALHRNNAPNERSFTFPGDRAGVSRVIDFDAANANSTTK